jgi:SH3-like domain-containing protein
MRRVIAAIVLSISSPDLLVSWVYGGETFPYTAYITADTEVRSGPGENFYPTDKLKRGDTVEVYRRTPDGWCAIRPPEGSFSWITGRALKLEDNNLAVVTQDEVASRVGSSLSDVRNVIQVRMRKGETVEILDPNSAPGGRSQVWYKIAPPSGEFRWILEKHIEKKTPGDEAAGIGQAPLGPENQAGAGQKASAEYQAEMDRIDLALSMMVVEEPAVWSFDALRIRTESLVEEAESAADRGRARLILNKIARFEDIKQRYDSVAAMREQTAVSNQFLTGLKQTMEKAAAVADPDGQFDGVGQLQQVFAPKLGAPRYALVDEAGKVRYYVTPAPGVNLQSYVGRQVGITGTRGYMPEQRAQHITARHVSSLESWLK